MPNEEDKEIQKYLKDNLVNGFVRRSISHVGHKVLIQRKKNREHNLCIDHRKLNNKSYRISTHFP